jgi:hypothetical protein
MDNQAEFALRQGAAQRRPVPSGTPPAEAVAAHGWFQNQLQRGRRVGAFTIRASLTPALADLLIGSFMPAGSNRRLNATHVRALAAAIRNGGWDANTHQGIAFGPDGVVNDGQHRIHAVRSAGRAIDILMTFGQPRSTFEVIDQVIRPRNTGTLLELAQLDLNTISVASAIARFLCGLRSPASASLAERMRGSYKYEVLAFARQHTQALREAVCVGRHVVHGLKARVSPSNLGAAFYLIAEAGCRQEDIGYFAEALASGANLSATSPILVCREGLRAGEFGKALRLSDDRRIHEVYAVIIAWNLWRQRRNIRNARWLRLRDLDTLPAVQP